MAGQVWNSLDENGLAGVLKGVVVWSDNLRESVGGAFHARQRIMAAPMLEKQAGTDEAAAQSHNLLPAPAAGEGDEIVLRATEEA